MSRFLAAALLALALAGCSSGSETRGGPFDGASAGVTGGFVRGGDTFGTNRRVDVYGGSTAPSLPTIGAPGYGK